MNVPYFVETERRWGFSSTTRSVTLARLWIIRIEQVNTLLTFSAGIGFVAFCSSQLLSFVSTEHFCHGPPHSSHRSQGSNLMTRIGNQIPPQDSKLILQYVITGCTIIRHRTTVSLYMKKMIRLYRSTMQTVCPAIAILYLIPLSILSLHFCVPERLCEIYSK